MSAVLGLCGGCGCLQPCGCNYTVVLPDQSGGGSGITNGVNVNTSGIGVLDAFNANTLYFRGVESGNGSLLAVSLNATNHTIVLTLNVNAIAAALPQATTTQIGVGETATDAEAQTKASTTVFLTPSNLAALDASTTFTGLIEIATDAEAITGTSTTLALTPANLTAVLATGPSVRKFSDSVARAATVPDYIGQIGYQVDTGQFYGGNAIVAGDWSALLTGGASNELGNTTIASGSLSFFDTVQFASNVDYNGCTLKISGVAVAADSVLTTGGAPGQPSALPIADFMSTANTQTGYTGFTNPSTIRTLNTATATTQQIAQCLGTLIEDLKAVLLPST